MPKIFPGPYRANVGTNRTIEYVGNKVYDPICDVRHTQFHQVAANHWNCDIARSDWSRSIARIDHVVFEATVDYFRSIAADWCNLPLTTTMISSPGEVYSGKTLDYTTDALPIQITWFDDARPVFLSESSQFYLELALLAEGSSRVFSIYNSFRKEKADFSRLSEFQHIEFEGHVSFEENVAIAINLMRSIVQNVLAKCPQELAIYLTPDEIAAIDHVFESRQFHWLTVREALHLLIGDTGDERYREHSLRNLGAWEEIRLTEILGGHVILTEMPLLEIPFYHSQCKTDVNGTSVAENADIILCGYRETIGSGVRITDQNALAEKARLFRLPLDDYAPYLSMRGLSNYRCTAGFGLGWQRLTHWLLKMPYIWNVCRWPRGETRPYP